MFGLSMLKVSLREWFLFGYNIGKSLLVVNIGALIIFHLKSTSPKIKSDFTNTSPKSILGCLKSTFSGIKKLPNKYITVQYHFYSTKSTGA